MEHEHPTSSTTRAIKHVLPDRAIVTRDARVMINTAASMFTLYLTAIAQEAAVKGKRSTIVLKDVLGALNEIDFEHFAQPVEQCVQDTKASDARKRARKAAMQAIGEGGEADMNVQMETQEPADAMQSAEESDKQGSAEEADSAVDEEMEDVSAEQEEQDGHGDEGALEQTS